MSGFHPPALRVSLFTSPTEVMHRNYHVNHCFGDDLMIKALTGVERLVNLCTGKRKYKCRACGFAFRAADRRRTPRELPGGVTVTNMST